MPTRQTITIPTGDIAVHELPVDPGTIYVVRWADPIFAVELVNHGGRSVWFTTDGRTTAVRGGHTRVALPYSSTIVNQVRRAPWALCLIAEQPTTVTLVAS